VDLTIADKKSVKKVKLKTNPVTIPNGRSLPPVSELDKTIGSTGRIHGERIVTIPLRKAKIININIIYCVIPDMIRDPAPLGKPFRNVLDTVSSTV
jgi:hypothetical protein